MDKELQRLLEEARSRGASTQQLDDILARYNAKKKEQPEEPFRIGVSELPSDSQSQEVPEQVSEKPEGDLDIYAFNPIGRVIKNTPVLAELYSGIENIVGASFKLGEMFVKENVLAYATANPAYTAAQNAMLSTAPIDNRLSQALGAIGDFYMDDAAKVMKDKWRDDYNISDEDAAKGIVGNISEGNVGTAAKMAASTMVQQIPQLGVMAATGGTAGAVVLGATAAGGKYAEIQDDPTLSSQEKALYSLAVGTAEGVAENLFKTDVRQFARIFGKEGTKETFKKALKKELKKETLLKSFGEEAGEEFIVAVTDNLIENGLRGNFDNWDREAVLEIADNTLIGGLMGGSIHGLSRGVNAIGSTKNEREVARAKNNVTELMKKRENAKPEEQAIIDEMIEEEVGKLIKTQGEDAEFYNKFTEQDRTEVLDLNKKIRTASKRYNVAPSDAQKAEIKKEIDDLRAKKTSIENKYAEEGGARYIRDGKEVSKEEFVEMVNNATPEDIATGQWGVENDDEVEQLLLNKLPQDDSKKEAGIPSPEQEGETPKQAEPIQEGGVEAPPTGGVVQEAKQLTLSDGTAVQEGIQVVAKNPVDGSDIQGTIILEGDPENPRVSVETETDIVELGASEDIDPADIKPFTAAVAGTETLTASEDGSFTYNKEGNPTVAKGSQLTLDGSKGLSAVSVFSGGQFVPLTEDADREQGLRVQMLDQDGNAVQLYGQDALDATYNIMLAMDATQAAQLNKLLDNEETINAIAEAEESARKDSEATQEAAGTAVEEAGERNSPEYVRSKVSQLQEEDVDNLKEELSGAFGLLTAENPDAVQLSEEENAARNEEAEAWLKEKGYSPRKISGRFEGLAENSFFVPNLKLSDALAFAKKFGQKSVAHSEGMIYRDGTMNPRVKGSDSFDFADFKSESDFVSTINTAEGPKTFSVGYDFDSRVNSGEALLAESDTSSEKFGSNFNTLKDNFQKLLSKMGGENIPVYVVNDEVYKSVTGKKGRAAFTPINGKNVIVLNADKATLGSVYHEMMHAYVATMKLSPKQIVDFVNTIRAELAKGNASERALAKRLTKFQTEYIKQEVYGKGLKLDDPIIAEEFLGEFVAELKDGIDVNNMSLSTIEKIRLAIAKFINKVFNASIDTSSIENRQEAFDFVNGFLDALEGRVTVEPSINKTANPNQAQRSRLQIEAPAGSKLFNTPLEDATTLARQYMDSKGLEYKEGSSFNKLDEKRAKRISDAYIAMKDEPTNPAVAAAYNAMAEETLEQYELISKAGYTVEMSDKEYDNSAQMIADLRDNKRMRIFSTEAGFGDDPITAKQRSENPLLQTTKYKDVNGEPLLVNDVFRFVHDFFGHAKRGNSFGPKGEENAWDVHSRMYTPLARRAMTSETRGQNSYVNFSGVNAEAFKLRDKARELRKEGKFAEAKELTNQVYGMMKFADQKVGLLPDEFVENPYDNAPELQPQPGENITREQIDAVNIISADTPKQKAKKEAVAEVLNGFAESQLPPNSSEEDLISRFLNNIFEESLYTLKKGPRESGMTWYIEDITEFENKMKVLLPELKDPNQMKLFKQVLAITSSGTNPNVNLQTAYILWTRSNGSVVNFAKNWGEDKISFINNKDKSLGAGVIVRELKTKYIVQKVDAMGDLETFKNGQPKLFEVKKSELKEGYPKPTGFTSRGSIVAQQLEKIEEVFKNVGGDIDKLVDFFEQPQPVSALRKYNDTIPDVNGDTKKVAVGKRNGAFIFGEKIGAFYQNMIGIGETITMDLWWSRTWNRYMGTMLSTVKGKKKIQETPRTDRERDIMRKAVTLAANKLNLDVSELQAVIWYFEQELWTKAGNTSPSFSYVTAVDALNNKIKTDEQTQKRFSEAGADLTAAEKRRQDAIARANNIIAEGGIQGDVAREQIDFAGIEMKVKETPGNTDPAIKTGGTAYVPVSTLYNLMDMRDGDRGGLYETAEDKQRVQKLIESFKKEGFEYKGSDALYVDIDAEGYGWIGEGNHRVLAARELGMSHLPVRVEFGAARDGISKYANNYSRVPTRVISKEKINDLKEEAEPYYHIKYASIWNTDLPTNPEPSEDVARQQISEADIEMLKDPRYVGHASPNKFDKFDPKRMIGGYRSRYGNGIYFSSVIWKIQDYGSNIKFIDVTKLNLLPGNTKVTDGFIDKIKGLRNAAVSKSLKSKLKGIVVAAKESSTVLDIEKELSYELGDSSNEIIEMFEALGYDGISIKGMDDPNYEVVVFRASKANEVLVDPTAEKSEVVKQQIDWKPSLFGRGQVNPAIVNRTTEVQQAASELLQGKITNAEYKETVRITQTIDPITQFFLPASTKDMQESLDKNKGKLLNVMLEDGTEVGLRLDIPAYKNRNIWVVSIHDKGASGKSLSYGSVAWATDVKFGSNPKVASFIAAGKNMDTLKKQDKTTIARMLGKWKNFEGKTKEERDASAVKKVEEIVKIENSYPGAGRKGSPWRQIGMNPFRHSFFYDRRNGKPVVSAAEVVQIGGLVYAKDVQYADWSDDQFTVNGYYDADGQPVKFQIDNDPVSKVEEKQLTELEKGEIPKPTHKKAWYMRAWHTMFRTQLETEILKLQESKEGLISRTEEKSRVISNKIKKYAKTKEALALANEYLTADNKKEAKEKILALPRGEKLLSSLREARAFIDGISESLVNDPAFEGLSDDLVMAIQNNLTTYLRTQYRFFTDKNFDINKRRDPAIQAQFKQLMISEIALLNAQGLSPLDIQRIVNERRDEIRDEAVQMIDGYISDLEDVKYQPSKGGAGIKLPNAPFKRKQELPAYIEQLLGKEKNPINRFAQTSQALANVLYKGRMVEGILNIVGPNSDYILDEDPGSPKNKHYTKINDPYSKLNGKWVHNEITDALEQKPLYSSDKAWVNGYFNVLKLARKSKVIWNITTWRKNLTGGWYFIMANGVANPKFAKDFSQRTKLMFKKTGETWAPDAETESLLDLMAEYGLIGKSIDANLIGMSQAAMQYGMDGDENAYNERAKRIWGNIKNKDKWLQEKYGAVDDYTKLIIFRSEIQTYAKKLYGKEYDSLTEAQKNRVHKEAAERVKESTPTFSRLPKWFDKVAAIPVVGDFVSFRLESLRSYGQNVWNGASDIAKSQEKGLTDVQKKAYLQAGLRRVAGSAAVFALKTAIVTVLSNYFLGDDEEELEDAAKLLRPEWMSGQTIIPRSIDKDGNVRVYNYSSEDPYGDVSDIFGGPESWSAMVKDFIRPNIAADLLFNLIKGEDIYGSKIADYSDSKINNILKMVGYVGKQIVVPPTISSSFRDAYLRSDLPKKDKVVNLASTVAERSLIRDYKYNIVNSLVQDLRKISETRKSYEDYDNPAKRKAQLDDIREKWLAVVKIGNAKGNYEMIDKAEKYIKRHLMPADEDYLFYE